ncbi:MAG: class I SAM-dependent methyltransferase [Myxococcales bacterium]|nr:class I SAM-dependent methyltransferase [Myxococcales bacterium]
MSVFGQYSEWYDLFYSDKDYAAEAAYVDELLRAHGARGGTLLEIGCGTGSHAIPLSGKGWRITGIDQSAGMLARAKERFDQSGDPALAGIELHQADARSFDLGRRFDVAVSLFHVMSYQAEPGVLESALATARRHLGPGGLFLFDFWFGPAVMAQRPEARERTVGNERFQVVRKARPVLHEQDHIVDVNYHFDVVDSMLGERHELDELHRMRYVFPEELAGLAAGAGFESLALSEWMTHRPPTDQTWNACAVFRALGG